MYFDKVIKVEETTCKSCHSKLDAHTSNEGASPKENDLSICGYCGVMSKFDKELNLIKLTDEELEVIKYESPESYKELLMLSSVIKQRANLN